MRYIIRNYTITGTVDSPQTIAFTDLTDIGGVSLPATFDSAPIIYIGGYNGDGHAYETEATGVSSFKIAKGALYGAPLPDPFTANFIIIGDAELAMTGSPDTSSMLDELGVLLGDVAENQFTDAIKIKMLKFAMDKLVGLLKENHLHELEAQKLAQTVDSDGAFDMGDLETLPWRMDKGLQLVKVTGGYPCKLMSFDEYKTDLRNQKVYYADKPKYYIRGDKIYPKPVTVSSTQLDLYYIKNFNALVSGEQNSQLRNNLTALIVPLACEDYQEFTPQAKRAYERAIKEIDILNNTRPFTDSNIFDEDEIPLVDQTEGFNIQLIQSS